MWECACACAQAYVSPPTHPALAPPPPQRRGSLTHDSSSCAHTLSLTCGLTHPTPAPPPPQRRGFLTYERKPMAYRPVEERVKDWKEVHAKLAPEERAELLHTQVRARQPLSCNQTSFFFF